MAQQVVAMWQTAVFAYRSAEDTMWGRLLLANAWPAYLFSLLLGGKLVGLSQRAADVQRTLPVDPLRGWATVAQETASLLFGILVVALFLVRKPVVGKHATWLGGMVALAGTFLLNAVNALPVAPQMATSALLASVAIVAVGTLFTIWSLGSLGRCFGLFPEARGLVRRGPYRWVRHPVYIGEIVSGFGLLVAKPHPVVIIFYGLFVALQYWRARLEEAALTAQFPDEYPAYAARTGRLLPRLRA